MSNYKFKVAIDAKDIYNKLLPEQKEKFNTIKITDVTLCGDKMVTIECLASTDEIIEHTTIQKLIGDWYISAI